MSISVQLTESGQRLYHIYRNFDEYHHEFTPMEFVGLLSSDPHGFTGYCLSCGKIVDLLIGGVFCIGCTSGAYRRTEG